MSPKWSHGAVRFSAAAIIKRMLKQTSLFLSVILVASVAALSIARPGRAVPQGGERGLAFYRQTISRLGKKVAPSAPVKARRHAARPSAFILYVDESLFLDYDADDALSFGDSLTVRGEMENYDTGAVAGDWEGILTITNDLSFLTNMTLRFPGVGGVTINGAALEDGSRSNLFLAPIVGVTGRIAVRGSAGFFNTTDNDLVVVLGAR